MGSTKALQVECPTYVRGPAPSSIQYSPKIMHAQELLLAADCGSLELESWKPQELLCGCTIKAQELLCGRMFEPQELLCGSLQ